MFEPGWMHPGSVLEARGAFVFARELATIAKELETLHATLAGEAGLRCMERKLGIAIQCEPDGHVAVKIRITPDHIIDSGPCLQSIRAPMLFVELFHFFGSLLAFFSCLFRPHLLEVLDYGVNHALVHAFRERVPLGDTLCQTSLVFFEELIAGRNTDRIEGERGQG